MIFCYGRLIVGPQILSGRDFYSSNADSIQLSCLRWRNILGNGNQILSHLAWQNIFGHLVSSSFGVFRNTRYALIMSTCNNHLSNHNINQTFLMEKIALKTKATFVQLCCCLHDHLSNNIDYKCKTFALKASFAAFILLIIAPMCPTIVAKKRTPQSILRLT